MFPNPVAASHETGIHPGSERVTDEKTTGRVEPVV